MFDWAKPTVQLLGRYQPWHDGHTALFKKALEKAGQVCIMCRDVGGTDAGVEGQEDNPFSFGEVIDRITRSLGEEGFVSNVDYIIMKVPNIIDISYGRTVGYTKSGFTFTRHDLGKEIHEISATKIRADMRSRGEL